MTVGLSGLTIANAVGGVDLVATPDYGITCAGGGGSCVDLDRRTPLVLRVQRRRRRHELSFDVSGNQRVDIPNTLFGEFIFGSNTKIRPRLRSAGPRET